MIESCGIDNWFNRRAGEAFGLDCPVELTFFEIITPNHCLDLAAEGVYGNQGPLGKRSLLQTKFYQFRFKIKNFDINQ